MKTLFAKLRLDASAGDVELWIDDKHIMNNIDVSRYPDVPLEEDLVIELDNNTLLGWSPNLRIPKGDKTTLKDIALVRVLSASDNIEEDHWEQVRDWAKKLQDEYRRLARGQWEVNVTPYVINNKENGSTGLRGMDWGYLRRKITEINPNNKHNYWHGLGGFARNFCGLAWVRGTEAWSSSACSYRTVIHEQGHNFGLGHAGDRSFEYGEKTTWQGTGERRDDSNTPHLAKMGLIEDDKIESLQENNSGIFFLAQGSTHPLALPQNVLKQIIVRRDGIPKILSISYHDGRVDVHVPQTSGASSFTYTKQLDSLRSGDRFNEFGITVEVLNIENGIATVNVNDSNKSVPATPTLTTPDENENPLLAGGFWGNTDYSVQGIQIIPLPDKNQVILSWLTWDRSYSQKWTYMIGDVDNNNVVSGKLMSANGPVGNAEIYFLDTNNAIFRAVTDMFDNTTRDNTTRIAMPLKRFASGNSNFYDIGDDEYLITLENDNNDNIAAFVLDHIVNRFSRAKTQRWRLLEGPKDSMKKFEISGGMIEVKADYTLKDTGTAKLTNKTLNIDGKRRKIKNKLA